MDSFATKAGTVRADTTRNLLLIQGSGADSVVISDGEITGAVRTSGGNDTLLWTGGLVGSYGPPSGSGSVTADGEAVWVSAHDVPAVWRLPLD